MTRAPRVLHVVTHPMTARHLSRGQYAWMRERGFETALAASPGEDLEIVCQREGIRVFPVPMSRGIDPLGDVRTLVAVAGVVRSWRPDVVNASTPKAGLLGMLAARIGRVPVRIYTLRGLRLETSTGWTRALLARTESLAAASSHAVFAVGPSLAERYLELGFTPGSKVRVIGPGSSNGVDVERFADPDEQTVRRLADRLGIDVAEPILGFVGRLTRDKGIEDLLAVFDRVREPMPSIRLLLVGEFESGDPLSPNLLDRIRRDSAIVHAGFAPDAAPYYHLMNVLAFSSRREGFPNVPLEAAASGVPVAGFRATGTVDAVVNGVTGTLVEPGDVEGLARAILEYFRNPEFKEAHGRAGRDRVRREFRPEVVWSALLAEYDRLLAEAGRTRPRGAVQAVPAC